MDVEYSSGIRSYFTDFLTDIAELWDMLPTSFKTLVTFCGILLIVVCVLKAIKSIPFL